MNSDRLEYLLNQHLDGTLPPEQAAALEERLAADPEAQALLAEYRSLDTFAKNALPLPEIKWDLLAERLSAAVGEAAAEDAVAASLDAQEETFATINEEYEFAVAQYADGTLPAEQRPAFERRLAAEPAARRLLEEYRSLDALARFASPAPDVNWDRFAARVGQAIDAREAAPASYSLKWLRSAPAVAMAATFVIGLGLAAWTILDNAGDRMNPIDPSNGALLSRVVEIQGPAPEQPGGAAVLQVELAEPTPVVSGSFAALSADIITGAPPRVEFAHVQRPFDDMASPY